MKIKCLRCCLYKSSGAFSRKMKKKSIQYCRKCTHKYWSTKGSDFNTWLSLRKKIKTKFLTV